MGLAAQSFARVRLFCDPMDCGLQAPLSMEFSKKEYWSGLPLPSSEVLPDPRIRRRSPILQADFLPGKPRLILLKTAEMNNPVVVLVKKSRSFVRAKIYRLYVA